MAGVLGFFGYEDEPEAEDGDGESEDDVIISAPKVQIARNVQPTIRTAATDAGAQHAPERKQEDGQAELFKKNRQRKKLPKRVAADSDGSSDDSDEGLTGHAVNGICYPITLGERNLATHVVLRVTNVAEVSSAECERHAGDYNGNISPGRHGLAHFLDCEPLPVTTATMCVLHNDESPPFEARRKRCIQDRRQMVEMTPDTRQGQRAPPSNLREMSWENDPGEVRVKLRPAENSMRAALVVGTEVVAVTRPLSLCGPNRRFFGWHELYRPGFAQEGIAERIGVVRLALELWPPGSTVLDPEAERLAELDTWLPGRSEPPEEERAVCGFCDGIGRKQCNGCFGHGVLVCTACDGTPALPCTQCKGTGILQDSAEGIASRSRGITSLAGRRCTTCWGASIACASCFGMGGLRCASCSGAGWTPCVHCTRKTGAVWY